MDDAEIIGIVAQAARGDRDVAVRATRATLTTLAERVGADEARHLIARLPPDAAGWMYTTGPAQSFPAEEFVRRVANQVGTDLPGARRLVEVVLIALHRAAGDEEVAHLGARLSQDYAPLLPRGLYAGAAVPADTFTARVAVRAGVDDAEAREAAEAVLGTLAERIPAGEVEDLMGRLPIALHPALRGAMAGSAPRMGRDEFVDRVARRTGAPAQEACEYARAVFAALRESVTGEEYFDVTVQLPDEYRTLYAEA